MIPFNKPYRSGNELTFISEAINNRKLSGDGFYTQKCQEFFQNKYNFLKVLLTTSCTHALEMAAILLNIQHGDEVIVPAFTFVTTANAFVTRGAKIIFADSKNDEPNIDASELEKLITEKTKAIVVVHYAGFACNMDAIMSIAQQHNIPVVEDAAQAIDAYYKNKPLGSFGDLATFSFHDTKNISCGEGGMLVINKEKYIQRAEIIREKGTNRAQFFKGEVDKYSWVDIGSSYVLSEINAAFLWAQIEHLDFIQTKRKAIWEKYYKAFLPLEKNGKIQLPVLPENSSNNGHLFYLLCKDEQERDSLIRYLREKGVYSVFHYLSLNKSTYYTTHFAPIDCPNSQRYETTLIRLPLFVELTDEMQEVIINAVFQFYKVEN